MSCSMCECRILRSLVREEGCFFMFLSQASRSARSLSFSGRMMVFIESPRWCLSTMYSKPVHRIYVVLYLLTSSSISATILVSIITVDSPKIAMISSLSIFLAAVSSSPLSVNTTRVFPWTSRSMF